jgi:hypothetical protein
MFKPTNFIIMAVVVVTLSAAPAAVWAQTAGSAFTYQGQLKETGLPADGSYDFQFTLYDDRGTRVGGPLAIEDHPVADGLFSVILDFGSSPFTGARRFLEIGVRRGASTGAYTILAPLQELTPAPYAAVALETIGVDGHSLDSVGGSVTDAVYVTADGRVNMSHGGLNLHDEAGHGVSFTTDRFWIDEFATESTVYDYRAGAKTHRFFTDGMTRLEIAADGNVGIGQSEPRQKLDVAGTVKMTGFQLDTGPTAGHVLTADAAGMGTWQPPAAGGSSPWYLGPEDTIHYADGYVGIGTGTPYRQLDVTGSARVFNGNFELGAEGFDPYIELTSNEDSDSTVMRLKSLDAVGFAVTDAADDPLFVVEESGDVGIGTTTPEHQLHVVSGGTGSAIFGEAQEYHEKGVYGKHIGASGGRGVVGEVTGTGGYGVWGQSVSGAGIYGEATGSSGKGVEGYVASETGYAVYGFNESSTGDAVGVYGGSGSVDGRGVYGQGSYGGYFEGKGYFSDTVGIRTPPQAGVALKVGGTAEAATFDYSSPRERQLTIAGVAFVPASPGVQYSKIYVLEVDPSVQEANFLAPVHLPDGAIVTELTAYVHDSSSSQNLTVGVTRLTVPVLSSGTLASVESSGTPGYESYTTTDINYEVITTDYAYTAYVRCDDWDDGLSLSAVTITYTVDHAD